MGVIQYFCGVDGIHQLLQTNIFNETSADSSSPHNSIVPHVAECVQQSFLILIPCLFLWIFLPVILYSLHKSQNGPLKGSSPITFRIIACAFLQLDVALRLLHGLFRNDENSSTSTWKSQNNSADHLIFQALLCLTITLAFMLILACRNRGVITSGVLFNFWLLLTVCGAPEFRYKIDVYTRFGEEADFSHTQFILAIAYYPLVVIIFFLSCFADSPKYLVADKHACPESTVSFLSQITFSWFDKMAMLGHKRALVMEDLWDLCNRDKSKHLVDKFDKVWTKYISKFNMHQSQSKSSKITLPSNGSPETQVLYPHSSNLAAEITPEPHLSYGHCSKSSNGHFWQEPSTNFALT
uniref:Uncharacterized protein n=1 Tax=Ditylenchus dipsaci TaxID=166011 RepID=A0A915DLQ5_9BILA